jgi:xanthine dehydrogenase YagR molybdenum-binding subunit
MSSVDRVTQAIIRPVSNRAQDERPDQERFLGKPVDRVDGRLKVTGTATFAAEYKLDGLVHAALVFSTIPKGVIEEIDTTQAEKVPGVLKIITHRNALDMKVSPLLGTGEDPTAGTTSLKILNTDRIEWNGQPVAVVVADTYERAEEAASLVRVTYAAEPCVTSFEKAIPSARQPEQILGEPPLATHGNAQAALRSSDHKVDVVFNTPGYNHNAIEPHACIAAWDAADRLTLYDATQFTVGTANSIAKMFDLKRENVRVISPFVGGGFGGKGGTWAHNQLCVLAAKMTGRPVRLALSREGVFRVVGGRTPSQQRVAIGANSAGEFTAFIHEGVTAQSPHNDFPEQLSFPGRHLYAMPAYRIAQTVCEVNRVANTFMRAPGESIGTFAIESAIDMLSYELKIDPVELRMRNEPDRDPVSGLPFSSRHLREAYRMGAEKFGWKHRPPQAGSQRDGDWLIGQGVATGTYPVYRMVVSARIRLNADGTASVHTSAQEMGMGTATVQTQHAAERLGIPMEKLHFEYGDSSFPAAGVAGGSSQTVSIAMAVQQASDKLLNALHSLAQNHPDSPLADAVFEDLHATREGLYRKDKRGVGESYVAILQRAGKTHLEIEHKTGQPEEIGKFSMHSYAAQFCEVRVNRVTGEVRVSRWVGSFDTGRILNPKTAVSQFRGGIVMGIGMALTEETLFDDRTGRIVNATLAEYHVPVQADIPHIDIVYTDIPDPQTPLGAHGIGEIGITGCAAAIANAVYHATGKRIMELPITLDKLL